MGSKIFPGVKGDCGIWSNVTESIPRVRDQNCLKPTSDPYELKQLENQFQFLRMDLEFQKGENILKWKWRERRRELKYEKQFQSLELERMMENKEQAYQLGTER